MEGMALSALQPASQFWRGRNVLITGHTGFKGGWLAFWLREMGAKVTGFALAPGTAPSLYELAHIGDGIRSVIGDLRVASQVADALREAEPEVVLHLAAQSLVRKSYADPIATFAVNVMGTLHVLQAVRQTHSVRAVVVVTSDKCYENREWPWPYREGDAIGGADPYSSSKGCAELLASCYRRSFFSAPSREVAIATARAGNVIGGGDFSEDRLLPDLVRSATAKRAASIRSPSAIRPWQHVVDPLGGYLLLAERLLEGGERVRSSWNFGPAADDIRTVSAVADAFSLLWGSGASWTTDSIRHLQEAQLLALDSSKARLQLGWRPRMNADEALFETVAWYKQWFEGADASRLQELMRSSIGRWCAPSAAEEQGRR